jgi:hypothetical protein
MCQAGFHDLAKARPQICEREAALLQYLCTIIVKRITPEPYLQYSILFINFPFATDTVVFYIYFTGKIYHFTASRYLL